MLVESGVVDPAGIADVLETCGGGPRLTIALMTPIQAAIYLRLPSRQSPAASCMTDRL
jgi:hypothetical protein